MLLGEFRCVADRRGRLALPPELRAALGAGLTVTRGIERCLFVYPSGEWEKLVERMRSRLPLTSGDARAFARLMFSGALVCVPDREGRIPLPGNLRQYAGIDDEAVVVGLCTHLEIWSPRRWREVAGRMAEEGPVIVERLYHLEV